MRERETAGMAVRKIVKKDLGPRRYPRNIVERAKNWNVRGTLEHDSFFGRKSRETRPLSSSLFLQEAGAAARKAIKCPLGTNTRGRGFPLKQAAHVPSRGSFAIVYLTG